MAIESTGHSRGNPRIYELIENAPKTGKKSPPIWAWPEIVDWLRIAGQPVPGPWPPHQEARPNPEEESLPVAVAETKRPSVSSESTGQTRGHFGLQDEDPSSPDPDRPPRRGVGWLDE